METAVYVKEKLNPLSGTLDGADKVFLYKAASYDKLSVYFY